MKYGTLKLNEDVVVPRSKVPALIKQIEEIGKNHQTFVANFGHAGDGNIHVNFMCDKDDPESIARARECVKETFQLSVELGGSISGEHGIGYVKAQYLDMAIDAPTLEVMKEHQTSFRPERHFESGENVCIKMNLKQKFKSAIKRGTGETHILIKENPTVDFSKEIIKAAVFNFAYDQQSEGGREFYIAELINLSAQKDKILSLFMKR